MVYCNDQFHACTQGIKLYEHCDGDFTLVEQRSDTYVRYYICLRLLWNCWQDSLILTNVWRWSSLESFEKHLYLFCCKLAWEEKLSELSKLKIIEHFLEHDTYLDNSIFKLVDILMPQTVSLDYSLERTNVDCLECSNGSYITESWHGYYTFHNTVLYEEFFLVLIIWWGGKRKVVWPI